MQCFTCSKTVSVRCENLSIGRIFLICSLAFLSSLTRMEAAPLCAAPCTLAWIQCLDTNVIGYALYYGITGSATTNRVDVGMTDQVTLNNLLASSNYFSYAVAYNSSGLESLPSALIDFTPQALSALQLTPAAKGSMSICFQVATGAVCHIEYTPTLSPAQWQTLGSATADACGNVTLTDSLTGNSPTRFYRAAEP